MLHFSCIDCVHHIDPDYPSLPVERHSRCAHEFKLHPVTGEKTYKYCDIAREHGPCGLEARFFEPKHDPRHQEMDDHDGELTGNPF